MEESYFECYNCNWEGYDYELDYDENETNDDCCPVCGSDDDLVELGYNN